MSIHHSFTHTYTHTLTHSPLTHTNHLLSRQSPFPPSSLPFLALKTRESDLIKTQAWQGCLCDNLDWGTGEERLLLSLCLGLSVRPYPNTGGLPLRMDTQRLTGLLMGMGGSASLSLWPRCLMEALSLPEQKFPSYFPSFIPSFIHSFRLQLPPNINPPTFIHTATTLYHVT